MPQKLGQHFLKNKIKLKKIVDALELESGDVVIEIGPGHGELTKEIKNQKSKIKIIAIEKDSSLVELLEKKFSEDKNIKVVEGDALKILPSLIENSKLKIENYKVVGNIPYYITGFLFRLIGELENKPNIIVFTIQKEVAERITAEPPRMNLLAASVQFWAEPKIIGYISKKDFRPVPKVDSAIIRLMPTRIHADQNADQRGNYYKFIRTLFKQPRKTIVNNLQPITNNKQLILEKLKKLKIDPQSRPQNLTVEQIMQLSGEFPPALDSKF